MRRKTRHTKIIFTIGPATIEPTVLEQLIESGVDLCRLNMAHASHDWTRDAIQRVREACQKVNRTIAFIMDVKGPEIRTGDVPEPYDLEKGEVIDFLLDKATESEPGVRATTVNYPSMHRDVKAGDTVLVDSGLIRLKILSVSAERIRCEVKTPGELGNRRHINLPGVRVNLPALTRKDRDDILVGVGAGVEYFALSFVREADDMDALRRYLEENGSNARIIAKVEDQCGLSNIEDILDASDGLMVARGDLGIEVPFEQLPVIQRAAVESCLQRGKPVIVATHLLESMITAPVPTRAEITDVANAVFEQADCVMLSGETTVGKYPVESVQALNRIIEFTQDHTRAGHNEKLVLKYPKTKMLRAAVVPAEELGGAAIVVFTRSGLLARRLSSLRPKGCPIHAFTDDPVIFKQLLILWGVEPFLMKFDDKDPELTIQNAKSYLARRKWAEPGDTLVVITNVLAGEKIVDTLQIRRVGHGNTDTSLPIPAPRFGEEISDSSIPQEAGDV